MFFYFFRKLRFFFWFALFLQIICLLAEKFEMTSSRYSYPILLDIFYVIGSFWKLIFFLAQKMSNPTSLQDQTFFYGFLKVYYKSSSVAAPLLFIYKARHLLGQVQIHNSLKVYKMFRFNIRLQDLGLNHLLQ